MDELQERIDNLTADLEDRLAYGDDCARFIPSTEWLAMFHERDRLIKEQMMKENKR